MSYDQGRQLIRLSGHSPTQANSLLRYSKVSTLLLSVSSNDLTLDGGLAYIEIWCSRMFSAPNGILLLLHRPLIGFVSSGASPLGCLIRLRIEPEIPAH